MMMVIRVAGFLSGVKLITSTANSMASATQNLILKNQLGFAEADLGFFMSAQFAFGAVANAASGWWFQAFCVSHLFSRKKW